MQEHQQRYQSIKKEKTLKIRANREASIKEQKDHYSALPYKPNLNNEELMDEINQKKKEQLLQEQHVKQKKDKVGNYAKYVREMYWPKVSVKKQLELEVIKTTLKN